MFALQDVARVCAVADVRLIFPVWLYPGKSLVMYPGQVVAGQVLFVPGVGTKTVGKWRYRGDRSRYGNGWAFLLEPLDSNWVNRSLILERLEGVGPQEVRPEWFPGIPNINPMQPHWDGKWKQEGNDEH